MKTMKRMIAAVLVLVLVLSLAACGGKDKDDPNLGKYYGTTVEALGTTMDMSEIYEGECYIELKSGNKCVMTVDGDAADGEWKLDGEELTITVEGVKCPGTLKDGVIVIDFMEIGMPMTFVKDGASAPKPTQNTDIELPTEPNTEATEAADPVSAYWEGDWYGWWVVTNAGGNYADWVDCYWDACATVSSYIDGTGNITIWDEDCAEDECIIDTDVTFGAGTTDYGCMMSESGSFWGCEIGHADWIVDPGASAVSSVDHMICIEGTYSDPDDNGDSWFDYVFYLRPWGMEWEDVRYVTDLPYDDMMPKYYDTWYLPLIESGVTSAPAAISVSDAPSGGGSGGSEPGAPVAGDAVFDYNGKGAIEFSYPSDVFTFDNSFGVDALENADSSLRMTFYADRTEEDMQITLENYESYSDYEDYSIQNVMIAGYEAVQITYNCWGDYYVDTYIKFGEDAGEYCGISISVCSYNSFDECRSSAVESVLYSIRVIN